MTNTPQLKPQNIAKEITASVTKTAGIAADEKLLNYVGASADGLRTDCGIALTDRQIIYFDPDNVWRVPLEHIGTPQYVCNAPDQFPAIAFGEVQMPIVGPRNLFRRLLNNLAALTGKDIALPHALPPDGVKFLAEIPRGIDIMIPFGPTPEWPDACARCCKPEPAEIYVITSRTGGTIANTQGNVLDLFTPFYTRIVDRLTQTASDFQIPLPYCKDCLATDKGLRSRGPAVLVREFNSKTVTFYFARRKYVEIFIALNTGRNPAEILPPLPGRKL